jgi:hypothetical protein
MSRLGLLCGVFVALILLAPSVAFAYFPPVTNNPQTPPDPFQVPGLGGLGEPEPPPPDKVPTVNTPEPATLVTALTGLAMAAGFSLRKRNQKQVA